MTRRIFARVHGDHIAIHATVHDESEEFFTAPRTAAEAAARRADTRPDLSSPPRGEEDFVPPHTASSRGFDAAGELPLMRDLDQHAGERRYVMLLPRGDYTAVDDAAANSTSLMRAGESEPFAVLPYGSYSYESDERGVRIYREPTDETSAAQGVHAVGPTTADSLRALNEAHARYYGRNL